MAIFFGGTEILNIPQIKFGNTDVQEVYWGGTKIWPAQSPWEQATACGYSINANLQIVGMKQSTYDFDVMGDGKFNGFHNQHTYGAMYISNCNDPWKGSIGADSYSEVYRGVDGVPIMTVTNAGVNQPGLYIWNGNIFVEDDIKSSVFTGPGGCYNSVHNTNYWFLYSGSTARVFTPGANNVTGFWQERQSWIQPYVNWAFGLGGNTFMVHASGWLYGTFDNFATSPRPQQQVTAAGSGSAVTNARPAWDDVNGCAYVFGRGHSFTMTTDFGVTWSTPAPAVVPTGSGIRCVHYCRGRNQLAAVCSNYYIWFSDDWGLTWGENHPIPRNTGEPNVDNLVNIAGFGYSPATQEMYFDFWDNGTGGEQNLCRFKVGPV